MHDFKKVELIKVKKVGSYIVVSRLLNLLFLIFDLRFYNLRLSWIFRFFNFGLYRSYRIYWAYWIDGIDGINGINGIN